jgi:serine/threonine protein kinase
MTSKAAKMRAQLTKMQANREDFETTKRDLEVQVNRGKNNFGKIQRGLKNNEIVDAPIETVEEVSPHPPTGKKGHGNISPKGRNAHTYSTMKPNANDAENSQNAEGNNQITIPSGVRVSDWCYTAPLDSQPPMVKSNEVYEKIRPLGRGAFGDVYLVKNTEDNKLFANKTIFSNKESELKEVLREVKFLRSNRHPCIVDIHDVFVTAQPRVLNIILSYCEAGDLAKVISSSRKSRINIPESQIIKWTMQIGLALHFLHENGILHRDLKPNNVMLTEGGDLVKVADFGLACDTAVDVIGSNEAGTPCYTAPEMIQNMAYSFPTDCFSFGVMLHEFLRYGFFDSEEQYFTVQQAC